MSASVSRSRKVTNPKVSDQDGQFVPSSSATVNCPREELAEPPFSIQEIRDAVPAHCFERSNLTSFGYLAKDLFMATILFFVGAWLHFHANMPTWLAIIVWPIYAFVQGTVWTGLWVLAHECGHKAFSPQIWVNDTVGWIVHSALLVPYFSWQFTHASHHLHTNHMTKDEVHVPFTAESIGLPYNKLRMYFSIFKHLVLGWPAYLVSNVSSNPSYAGSKNVNHFSPKSPLFSDAQRPYIILSDIGIVLAVAALSYLSYAFGTPAVLLLYVGPYLIVNCWLVLITKLQHTANDLPHYSDHKFSWVKGQLCTVDRDFGWLFNTVLHHINDTHIAHHLFSKMPHYHAEEATKHLKNKLGKHYRYRSANVITQTLETWNECVYVAEKHGIWWYPPIGDDHTEPWTPQ